MKITVKVKTGAKEERVERVGDSYIVFVKSFPEKGKANKDVIRALACFFKVAISDVEIISGFSSSKKLIYVQER